MLNNNNGRSLRNKLIKDVKECLRIKGMKADGRFIKDKDCIFLPLPHVAGKFQPLRFTAGKAGRCFFQRQIPQAQVFQDAQFFRDLLEPLGSLKGITISIAMSSGKEYAALLFCIFFFTRSASFRYLVP